MSRIPRVQGFQADLAELTCEPLEFGLISSSTAWSALEESCCHGKFFYNEVRWHSVRLLGHGFLKNNHLVLANQLAVKEVNRCQ